MLISSLTGAATLTFAWLVQPYFIAIGVPVELYGILWTALNLTVGISSVFAHRVGRFINSRFMVPTIVISITAGYLLTGFIISRWGISLLFLFYVVRGVATPMLKNHLHQYTASDVRATILSVRDFSIRIIFAIIGPALGWLTDHVSLQSAFVIAGGFYFIAALFVIRTGKPIHKN
jgi:sugar phosphate permease